MTLSIFKKQDKEKDLNLLVAATVIAAMAYQAALSPPGGVASVDATAAPVPSPDGLNDLGPGDSLLAYFYADLSNVFWIANTISLMASLSVIFLYVSGLSLKRKFQIWIIRVAMWITLSSMTVAYVCAVIATSPITDLTKASNTVKALVCAVLAWVLLLALSFFVLVIRLFLYIVRKIIKCLFCL